MNYFNWEDLVAVYPNVAKDRQAEVNSNIIPYACAFVDAFAGGRYTVPFTPSPLFIKDLAIDVCYWRLTMRQDGSDKLKDFIDERTTLLTNGTITLVNPVTGIANAAGGTATLTSSGQGSSFGMDRPEDWRVDVDWQAEFRDSRGWGGGWWGA